MSFENKKLVSLILLAVSVLSWIARRAGLFYVPALTAFTLAASMLLLGTATLRTDGRKKIFAALVIAFGILNILVGALELYSYFAK